jgi:hypothetical protein
MNLADFKASLGNLTPPENISVYLQALWYDAKDYWDRAHNLIDHLEEPKAYWVHAYLHRREGDKGNALYWYNRADKKMPGYALEEEWEEIVQAFL